MPLPTRSGELDEIRSFALVSPKERVWHTKNGDMDDFRPSYFCIGGTYVGFLSQQTRLANPVKILGIPINGVSATEFECIQEARKVDPALLSLDNTYMSSLTQVSNSPNQAENHTPHLHTNRTSARLKRAYL